MKSKVLQPLTVQRELFAAHLLVFNPEEFRRFCRISAKKAKYFLETYTCKGLLVRLKKGLYALANDLPDEREIANHLYRPSYISFEYALAQHGIIPEMVYSVTSATTKPTRVFEVQGKTFMYFTIQKKAFAGYQPIQHKGRVVLMAEPEKALADTLYFVSIGQKTLNERMNLKAIDFKKLKHFARLFGRPGLTHLINQLQNDQ